MTPMLVLLLAVFVPIGLIAWFFIRATARSEAAVVGDPPNIRTNATFVGGEHYRKPDESLDDTFGCGVGLLTKLAEGLHERGLETGDVTGENWGARLEVFVATSRLDVDAGYRGDDWLIVVGPARDSRARVEDDDLRRVLKSLHERLKELDGIERVAWHRSEDPQERGASRPFDGAADEAD